jgi:Ser-tRNA(Ala) deacylase AlaX
MVIVFFMSVMSNHTLLHQKKQILKQQRLKLSVPAECMKDENEVEEKSRSFNLMSHVKSFLGYSATSRQCLEYQEALFIDSDHNNYIETIMFTLTESLKPFAAGLGEFINNFYSSLGKDMPIYQYVPLTLIVTTCAVPILLYIVSLLSLVLFGYEFNFFHLISFRKSQNCNKTEQGVTPPAIAAVEQPFNAQILSLLAKLNNENEKLCADANKRKTLESSSPKKSLKPLAAIANESFNNESDLNESLKTNMDVYISNVKSKEEEYQTKINALKAENAKLKTIIIKTPVKQQRSLQHEEEEEKENLNSTPINTKVVQIGFSKTVSNGKSHLKRTKEQELLQESNDSNTASVAFEDTEDDDADDIYVILEDNSRI